MHDVEYFRETPPDPDLKPDYSERFHMAGYNRISQELGHRLYKDWISTKFPRMILVEIQHANPYYDDSYAVNSANLGPYGDAIMDELIPYLEKKYRAIGQGWGRFAYGGSTGGWESLAVQTFYPERFNGIWAACPDPVDFHDYATVDLYDHRNAHVTDDYAFPCRLRHQGADRRMRSATRRARQIASAGIDSYVPSGLSGEERRSGDGFAALFPRDTTSTKCASSRIISMNIVA